MKNNRKNTIAVFDFDGTITINDTFRDFFIWSFGPIRFYVVFTATIPLIVLYLLGVVSNDFPKAVLFRFFFRGFPENKYLSLCREYAANRIPVLTRPDALERIKWHKNQGHILVINSASLCDWINPWAIKHGFDYVIATGAKIEKGNLSGDFSGRCSYGPEKVAGLKQLEITNKGTFIYAYGDSKGDKDLLALADNAEFRAFH